MAYIITITQCQENFADCVMVKFELLDCDFCCFISTTTMSPLHCSLYKLNSFYIDLLNKTRCVFCLSAGCLNQEWLDASVCSTRWSTFVWYASVFARTEFSVWAFIVCFSMTSSESTVTRSKVNELWPRNVTSSRTRPTTSGWSLPIRYLILFSILQIDTENCASSAISAEWTTAER